MLVKTFSGVPPLTSAVGNRIHSWLVMPRAVVPLALFMLSPCPEAKAQALRLEEVLVTAQKRSQSLFDVPLSVSVMTDDSLVAAGVLTLEDMSRLSPALELQSNNSPVSTNYRVRRVGNLGNIPTFESAVGLFVDGAFRSRSIFGVGELLDVQRIELLRGPQSTLYGKNTSAGVIAIHTAEPTTALRVWGELTGGVVQGGEDAATAYLRAGVAGPLQPDLRASIGMSYAYHQDTFDSALRSGGEDSNDLERLALRSQLLWDASEQLSLRLILGSMRQRDNKLQAPRSYGLTLRFSD